MDVSKKAQEDPEASRFPVVFEDVGFIFPEGNRPVFENLSISLPPGVVSFVGQNGTGKSTIMVLAGGRLHPATGTVRLFGRNTEEILDEEELNRYASIIYQNMELEAEESIGELLEFVYAQGNHERVDHSLIGTLIRTFELTSILGKKMQTVSKGELQRTIIAFSLLYGSPLVLMDEPIFALEDYQKEYTMKFLTEYAASAGISIYYSVHELELSRRYSDMVLLFAKDGSLQLGPPQEILTRENLEEAYQIPYALLHRKDHLFREVLMRQSPGPTGEPGSPQDE